MITDGRLRDKLRKIEALFAGAGTEGERLAAEAALERVRLRLESISRRTPPTECRFRFRTSGRGICFWRCAAAMGSIPIAIHGSVAPQ
jgi:hypothetical protein